MSKETTLRFRQIHLDFHTSEQIAGVGEDFDPDEFADTLAKAHVNSVTCFARCHHGYIYFDTKKHPERKHPTLRRNLLAEQIEACHKRNIRVPIYTTVQWDQFTAKEHPEWLAVGEDGTILGTKPFEAGFYRSLLVNSPYLEFLKAHVREILETLPVDGFFFDILLPIEDVSSYSQAGMKALGLNPKNSMHRKQYGYHVLDEFKTEMTRFVREVNPDCTIFYNGGHVGPMDRPATKAYTHYELESLPSGGWGYIHFPLTGRFARGLGKDMLGMTGKFHTSWGDFHSFKNAAALQYECFRMLAMNAKCGIGDQLHPTGKICQTTYRLIGEVYAEVEKKEPWCADAKPLTEIGVLTTEEFTQERIPLPTAGAVRMLEERSAQFDVLDSQSDLSGYRLLILPDGIVVSEKLSGRLREYLKNGGKIIASYRSGIESPDLVGVRLKGDAPFSPDFILPHGAIGKGLPETEHVMYLRGLEVESLPGSTVLAETIIPYFNRTWEHFCSHRHTPSSKETGYPAITQKRGLIYFAHPIFTQYAHSAPRWCKQLFSNALDILLPDPLVKVQSPSTLLTTINEQRAEKRLVLHLLHYIPERRGMDFDTIEDVIPLYQIPVSIRSAGKVKWVASVPQGVEMPFNINDGRIEFTVPQVMGHQMVEIAFD